MKRFKELSDELHEVTVKVYLKFAKKLEIHDNTSNRNKLKKES